MQLRKLTFLVTLFLTGPALAETPNGSWRVQDGSGTVRIAPCGRALCGYATNGQVVLKSMGAQGPNRWVGTMIDIRSGNAQYDGSISLADRNTLRVKGCLQGSTMCGEQTWMRVN